jgi:putative lipoic acid-binding regulatory protein
MRNEYQELERDAQPFQVAHGYVCTTKDFIMDKKWAALEEKLEKEQWPSVYMFKFIVPADNERIAQVENLFDTEEAEVTMRTSKKGNFVSLTAKEMMLSAANVIVRYKEAAKIEGVISL